MRKAPCHGSCNSAFLIGWCRPTTKESVTRLWPARNRRPAQLIWRASSAAAADSLLGREVKDAVSYTAEACATEVTVAIA
jgi:hypothetical protein